MEAGVTSGLQKPHIYPSAPFALKVWILFCAYSTCLGWALSYFGILNRAGYAVGMVAFLAIAGVLRQRHASRGFKLPRFKNRFSAGVPMAFLLLAILAIAGGAIYPPSNPDGLTHRVPRLLNWLAEGRWHWIENAPASFNTRATGFEWAMAPIVSLTNSDRFVFLLNVWGFLLLPGLTFSVFRRLGVSSGAAWRWMWLVPTGYCFLLQAGSIANDLYGAVLALAAMDFALRARDSGRAAEAWYSIVACALITNAKSSNLTLLLPLALALLPSVRIMARRFARTAAVCCVAAVVSLAPNSWFNIQKLGDWTGSSTEAPLFAHLTPATAFAGNTLNLLAQNFCPPFFPVASWWNTHFYRALPESLLARLEQSFEPGGAHVQLMEMQLEVAAGVGFGVSLLVLYTFLAGFRKGPGARTGESRSDLLSTLVCWAVWVSLAVYMIKTGLSTSARIITPYYALLFPALLRGQGRGVVVQKATWKILVVGVLALAGLVLIMNPPRPLWPARAFFNSLARHYPDSVTLRKAAMLYQSYADRSDVHAAITRHLPSTARNVGFVSFISASSIETSLWRPFGSRRIWWLTPSSKVDEMRRKAIEYVIIGTDGPNARKGDLVFERWFDEWKRGTGASAIASEHVQLLATGASGVWHLVRIPMQTQAAL